MSVEENERRNKENFYNFNNMQCLSVSKTIYIFLNSSLEVGNSLLHRKLIFIQIVDAVSEHGR